ncbi:MAG TPA: M13 family metallopeptidase [Gemmatimonadales bacterium]|nr:M13 family metallopeptidase [Gemmatimonadales bacterium]
MRWTRRTALLFALLSTPCVLTAQARPGDDFFGYANAAWLAGATIPEGKDRLTARNEIDAKTRQQLDALFAGLAGAPSGSLGARVQAFLAAATHGAGATALQPRLDSIEAIRDKAELTRALGRDLGADVDPLNWGTYQSAHILGLAVEPGLHGEAHNVVILTQGGAGAEALDDGSASDSNAANLWTRAELIERAPGMDWSAFLDAAGLGGVPSFIIWQPKAMIRLAAQVEARPLEEWKSYLEQRLRDRHPTGPGRTEGEAREAALRWLPEAIGQLYAERYFPPAEKRRAERIVAGVIKAFRHQVVVTPWLSPAARATALAKIDAIKFSMGYPDRWEAGVTLQLDPADRIGNQRRIERWNYQRALGRIGRPVDRSHWWVAPHRVIAILMFQQNAYNFPAAFLQPPKYDPAASDAANYGAIGAIVGHEVSHFVDLLGADYGVHGELRHWWTPEDHAGFRSAASVLARQVAGYRPAPGMAIDTALTMVENVADLTGLRAAFAAHRAALGPRAADTAYVRRQDREFFLGFARSWRGQIRDSAMATILASDNHAPERYRVALVRNLDAWYDAFGIQPRDALYLRPEERVRIW